MLQEYDLLFWDIDGTLIDGKHLLPAVPDWMTTLRMQNKRMYFVTNHPIRSKKAHCKYLNKLGLKIHEKELITPIDALQCFFHSIQKPFSVYPACSVMIKEQLEKWNIPVINNVHRTSENTYVVLGLSLTSNYRMLQDVFLHIQRGARLVVLNEDFSCPFNGEKMLDTGAFLSIFQQSGELKEEPIPVGKPSVWMQQIMREKMQLCSGRSVIIGDSLLTDIAIGNALHMDTVWLTKDVEHHDAHKMKPTYIFESLAAIHLEKRFL
ncbi:MULTISPECIES: HAD-IIA family hydrolase [Bacillus]|uniref:HAD-IIA family hydrolase n=1 Tax=Bacillus TaxID=1386 RepID=UPI0002DBAF90|nr:MULTISPECIES: HAD-IIA family hydrolase [Bacillus]